MIKELIKKQNKDIIDKQILIKKFFKTIYRNIGKEEYIRTFQSNKDNTYNKVNYFTDIDDLVNFSTNKYNHLNNTYFTLAATDGVGGAEENLKYRYCIAFDLDKKDLGLEFNHKDIVNKFKELKIYYHALVDSGNGYHVYIVINKTDNLNMVEEVQKALAIKLNADLNAIKTTQLLRIPFTYNVKGDKAKEVKLVHLEPYDSNNFRPYDIEFLYKMNCSKSEKDTVDNTNIKYTLNNTNIPICIQNILEHGSEEGNRYEDLQRIVVMLRQRNKDLSNIKEVCKEWAEKSNYKDNLDYRVEHIYNSLNYINMDCKECKHKQECYSVVISDFDFDSLVNEDGVIYDTYNLEDKVSKKIKNKQNRGGNMLNGNEILIINVLRNEFENPRPLTQNGMDIKLLTSSITYKKKSCLSEKTLRETLQSLVDKKYINEEVGARGKKFYKFNPIKCKVDNTIRISYFATIMCICGNITPSELGLYILMRYIHKEQQLQGIVRGNIFQLNQNELAKKYYGKDTAENQGHISNMISNLIECKILEIYDKQISKNNGFEYNIYRLNS